MKYLLAAVIVSCALSVCSAQVSSKRSVDVTVTEPHGRFVTGLDQASFEVIEAGVRRVITAFSDVGSPISLAIVSEESLPALGTLGPEDELIQTPSVSNAVRQLEASKNPRKVIVILTSTIPHAIPSGIQILQTDRAILAKAVIELRNQYRLEFESSTPSASVEVVLKQPAGVPRLAMNWK